MEVYQLSAFACEGVPVTDEREGLELAGNKELKLSEHADTSIVSVRPSPLRDQGLSHPSFLRPVVHALHYYVILSPPSHAIITFAQSSWETSSIIW
jgi:hypothetical protein